MKTIKLFAVVLMVGLLSCNLMSAQPAPVITKKYSNAEIEKMVEANNMVRSADVLPTTALSQKFVKDFPQAVDVDWELGADVYEVDFEINRADYKAFYNASGDLLMYKYDIRTSALPANVKNVVTSKYPDYRFEDTEKVLRGTDVFYKIEIERGERDVKLILKSDGTIVNEYVD